jgi:hypothetical protein
LQVSHDGAVHSWTKINLCQSSYIQPSKKDALEWLKRSSAGQTIVDSTVLLTSLKAFVKLKAEIGHTNFTVYIGKLTWDYVK